MRMPQLRLHSFHIRNPFRNRPAETTPAVVVTQAPVAPVRPVSLRSLHSTHPDEALLFEPCPNPVTPIPGSLEAMPTPEPGPGSGPPSYRSRSIPDSAAPSYQGSPLREGEIRLQHDGQPIYERTAISGGRMGTPHPHYSRTGNPFPDSADISPLNLSPVPSLPGTPHPGAGEGLARSPSLGSAGSMTSSQLEAHLESLPLLSRLPTPP